MTERNWKKSTGTIPVDGKQMVTVKFRNGDLDNGEAKWYDWSVFDSEACITHWDYDPPYPVEAGPNPHDRASILDTAKEYITKDRAVTHGQDAENSFGKIADMWSAYLGHPVSREDVCAMMVLLKVARFSNSPNHADHTIDICGYAAIAGEMATGG